MIKKTLLCFLVFLIFLFSFVSADEEVVSLPKEISVNAQGVQFASEGIQENIDIYNGAVNIIQTDTAISGSNGLGMAVTRNYNSNLWQVWRDRREMIIGGIQDCVGVSTGPYGWENQHFLEWEENDWPQLERDLYENREDERARREYAIRHGLTHILLNEREEAEERIILPQRTENLCEDRRGFEGGVITGFTTMYGNGGGAYDYYVSIFRGQINGLYNIDREGNPRNGVSFLLYCYQNRNRMNDRIETYYNDVLNPNLLGYGFGMGWSYVMPRVSANIVYLNESFRDEEYNVPYLPRVVFPDGSSEAILYNDETGEIFTEGFSKVSIVNESSVKIKTSSGTTYSFDWFSRSLHLTNEPLTGDIRGDMKGLERFLYLTKVEDEFGNYLLINYLHGYNEGGDLWGNLPYITSIKTSNGKEINFGLGSGSEVMQQARNRGEITSDYSPTGRFMTMDLDSVPILYYTNVTYKDSNNENITLYYKYDFHRVKDESNRGCYAVQCDGDNGQREIYPGICTYGFLRETSYYKGNQLLKPSTKYEYNLSDIGDYRNMVIPYDISKLIYPSGLEVEYEYGNYIYEDPLSRKNFHERRVFSRVLDNGDEEEIWRYGYGTEDIRDERGNVLYSPPNEHNIRINLSEIGGIGEIPLYKTLIIKPDNTQEIIHYFPLCKGGCSEYNGITSGEKSFLGEYGGKIFIRENYNMARRPIPRELMSVSYYSYTPKYIGKQPTASFMERFEEEGGREYFEGFVPRFRLLSQAEVVGVYGDDDDGDGYVFDEVKFYAIQSRESQDSSELQEDSFLPVFSNFNFNARDENEISRESPGDFDKYLNSRYNINYGEARNIRLGFSEPVFSGQDNFFYEQFGGLYFMSNWLEFENILPSDDIIVKNNYLLSGERFDSQRDGSFTGNVNGRRIVNLARENRNFNLLDNSKMFNKTNGGNLNLLSQSYNLYSIKRVGDKQIIVPYQSVNLGLNRNRVRDRGNNIISSEVNFNDRGFVETQKTINGATFDLYIYDDEGRIIEVYSCLNTDRECTRENGRIVSSYRYYPNDLIKEVKDAENSGVRYRYDSLNRPIEVSRDDTWRGSWERTNPNLIYEYDNNNRILKITSKKDENNYLTPSYFFYNQKGQLVQSRQETENNDVFVSSVKYDVMGRAVLSSKTYVERETPARTYSPPDFNSLLQENKILQTEYDDLGRVKRVINFDGSAVSNSYGTNWTKSYNENGIALKYEKDAFGNLVKVVEDSDNADANLRTSNYKYDSLNRNVEIKDAEGRISNNFFDTHSRMIRANHPDIGIASFSYDEKGNLVDSTDANENTIRRVYDGFNRLSSIVYPDETSISYSYDWCYAWKLCSVGWTGGSRIFEYDSLGRITKENLSVDDNTLLIEYTYDIAGNLVKEDIYSSSEPQPIYEFSISYEYDELNRIFRILFKIRGDVAFKTGATFYYTPQGNIEKVSYGNGVITNYAYNEKELLNSINTGIRDDGGIPRRVQLASFFNRFYEYDGSGNLLFLRNGTVQNSPVLAEFTYDNLNRLIEVRDNNYYGEHQRYSYDNVGNRIDLTIDEGGNRFDFLYNYDSPYNNKLVSVTRDGNNFVSLEYDLVGNVILRTKENNMQSFSYDYNNMLKEIDFDGDNESDENYFYDFQNLRVKKVERDKTIYYFRDLSGNTIYELCRGRGCVACVPENFNWEGNKFIIQDANGSNISMIDDKGMMLIKGTIQNPNAVVGDVSERLGEIQETGKFVIRNNEGRNVSWINSITGNLYLIGRLNQNTEAEPLNNVNEYIIQNSTGGNVAWFDESGNLYLRSCLVQNYAFGE